MPCDSIVLNNIEISVANEELLTKALAEVYRVSEDNVAALARKIISQGFIRLPAGKLLISQEGIADRIKQEYSRQAILQAARKNNWRLQENPRNKKMLATRRA